MNKLNQVAADIGIGLVAGFVGTAAITLSQLIEMRVRHRKPSNSPAEAVENVFEVLPADRESEARLNTLAHWTYGTVWGSFRGVLDAAGLRGVPATLTHAAALQGTALVLLPGVKVAPPPTEWGASEIAIETLHHLVYATAAGLTYEFLRGKPASVRTTGAEPEHGWFSWGLVAGALPVLTGGAPLLLARRAWHLALRATGRERPTLATRARRAVTEVRHGHWNKALAQIR